MKQMIKVIVFGNSGSGKTTLAKEYTDKYGVSHLDLDTLAWQETNPPTRKPIKESIAKIELFLKENTNWVIEGCYSDLLNSVIKEANELVFLNPGVETCIKNCRNRAWEPHKYKSKEEQDRNLEMLLKWVKQYSIRTDEFSLVAHQKLFQEFIGKKTEYLSNNYVRYPSHG